MKNLSPGRVRSLSQMNDHTPAKLVQIISLSMLPLTDICGLDRFFQLDHSSIRQHTMKSPGRSTGLSTYGRRKIILKHENTI